MHNGHMEAASEDGREHERWQLLLERSKGAELSALVVTPTTFALVPGSRVHDSFVDLPFGPGLIAGLGLWKRKKKPRLVHH